MASLQIKLSRKLKELFEIWLDIRKVQTFPVENGCEQIFHSSTPSWLKIASKLCVVQIGRPPPPRGRVGTSPPSFVQTSGHHRIRLPTPWDNTTLNWPTHGIITKKYCPTDGISPNFSFRRNNMMSPPFPRGGGGDSRPIWITHYRTPPRDFENRYDLHMVRSAISRERFSTMFRSKPTTLLDAIVRKTDNGRKKRRKIVVFSRFSEN